MRGASCSPSCRTDVPRAASSLPVPALARLRQRPSGAFLVSLAIHAVVVAFFVQALLLRNPLVDLFGRGAHRAPPVVERIGFLQIPKPTTTPGAPRAGRAGGDGRAARAAPRLVAPRAVPSTIPAVSTRRAADTGGEPSTGPLVGGGGPLRGVQPRYTGPRVWTPAGTVVIAPKTPAQALDSVITAAIAAHNDSMRVAQGSGRAPGDWTFEHNGKKYGIDRKFIRLGPVSIPTAVLALLPLNITGNPTVMNRERTLTARHDEIFEQAQRGMNDADFQRAVRETRLRLEREHEARVAARAHRRDSVRSP